MNERDCYEGEGKYEVRYWYIDGKNKKYKSEKTNSWFEFMKLRFTKDVIYYKVLCSK